MTHERTGGLYAVSKVPGVRQVGDVRRVPRTRQKKAVKRVGSKLVVSVRPEPKGRVVLLRPV